MNNIRYKSFIVNRDNSHGILKIKLTPRTGDKRSYYIRANFDGRFTSGFPDIADEICRNISPILPKKTQREVIIGFAEGSLILAYVLAKIRGSNFACSTKTQRSDLKSVIEFAEEHRSFIPSHYLYSLRKNDEVIIFEDEISTGKTVINAYEQLRKYGFSIKAIASIVEITNFDGRKKIKDSTNLDLVSLTSITLIWFSKMPMTILYFHT